MKQEHFISIILPVYNGEDFLADAIQSCLDQSYSNLELIIVDDCSTDRSLQIANLFSQNDNRVRILTNTSNKKLPDSLNIGHQAAMGEYLTWTSHDNLLKPDFLKFLVDKLASGNIDIVFSDYDIIREDGSLKRNHIAGPVEHLLTGNRIGASFLYKKEVFLGLGGYRTDLFLAEDYDFWLRAMSRFKFLHVKQNLYSYRIHENSLTSSIHFEEQKNKKFKMAITKMFNDLGKDLQWAPVTVELILDLHSESASGLGEYLNNRELIKTDLKKLNLKFAKLKFSIIKKLRSLLKEKKELQRPTIIGRIIIKDSSILFHRSFNPKETVKIITKTLK